MFLNIENIADIVNLSLCGSEVVGIRQTGLMMSITDFVGKFLSGLKYKIYSKILYKLKIREHEIKF